MLGLSPLLILSFYLFLKKKYRIVSILITFLAIVIDIFAFSNLKNSVFSNKSNEMKQDAYVMVIKQSLLNEDYENAKVLIHHYEERYGETFESILSLARYELLNNNVEEAGLLYEKAQWIDESKSMSKEENEIYEYIKSNQLVNMTSGYSEVAMANYIDLVGKKPEDYGYDTGSKRLLEVNSKMLEAAQSGVSKEIEEEYDNASDNEFIEGLQRGLDLKTELDQMYDEYLTYGSVDEERAQYIEKNLGKIYGQYQELFSDDLLHNSYYQVLLMNENYKKLVRLASDTDDLELYMLLSELYMSGAITKDDLEQVDFLDDLEDYEEVLEICENVARDYRYENKRKAPKKVAELEEKVTSIENTIENLQLVELQLQMENITTEEEDKSKFNLILAKINEYLGNEEKAQTYIEEALEAANESKDGSYKKVMEQINDVIKSNSDISELKEVSNYIIKAYEEALPVKILETSIQNTDFSDFVSDYVSTKQAMINICGINIEDFPKVTAYVQFGTPIQNAELLEVKDVNQIMTDVKLSKKKYAQANILLTCDISGSMSGNEEQLKNAVATFAEYKTDIEQIGLIGFNDGIVFDTEFYDLKDQLLNYTDQLTADGGTNIFGAIQHSISKFGNDSSVSKTVIVMTDGEDGYNPSKEELENLRRTCTQKNITIYTVGLGSSVNAEYLSNLASYGNGKFVYCNNAASLESLFDFIHSQIDNTYELTYTAKDEVTNKRQLALTNMSDNSSDTKTYYLKSEDETDETKDDIFSNDVVGDIWVDGVAVNNS